MAPELTSRAILRSRGSVALAARLQQRQTLKRPWQSAAHRYAKCSGDLQVVSRVFRTFGLG
jgi:hypothetical protein